MKFYQFFSLLAVFFLIAACNSHPYKSANRSYKKQAKSYAELLAQYPLKDSTGTVAAFIGTTNFNLRKPNFVIIHHTAQNSCEQTLKTFTTVRTQVSAHYVICKDGTIHHMLNDYLRAWHGGVGKWGNASDINSLSIGIELDNNGFEPFSEVQIASLSGLLGRLKKAYNIPEANFIGHADIAPGRKVDPNRFFPWKQMSSQGYGLWYDTTSITLPPDFNALSSLRIIGYDIKNPTAAIQSFKIHFVQNDTMNVITEGDRKIIFDLARKAQ
jgi:N-acetylmuramoyl-L-alanine amidase